MAGHAWAEANSTQSDNLAPMFSNANINTNTYANTAYNFSLLPPKNWIPLGQQNSSDNSVAVFGNENPQSEATFAIYYHQGEPIPDALMQLPDSQILQMSIPKLFDISKYAIYQQNIEKFSDGFVIQAVASENQTTSNTPVVEEFAFWLKDGRQYFLVMVSAKNGFYQNAAEFERSAYTFYVAPMPTDMHIPSWVKNNAKWWASGTLDDKDFLSGIQYLVQQGIIVVPPSSPAAGSPQQIPAWIKNSAGWWAEGKISDSDFVKGIQYLISNNIICSTP